ncbi:MAG: HAD family hydrolase [Gammaproteobacteria bacterium]|nr:HAD family hydrolase [Gammaproteobacteria bacterium]
MTSSIYALDFDGVICDSAVETGITGWKAAATLWPDFKDPMPDKAILDAFRKVRPVLETGYEAILIMRLLKDGEVAESLVADYSNRIASLIHQQDLDINELKQRLGATRDTWIASDLESWIARNPLFPGIIEQLITLNKQAIWYIITTKQERFVKQILEANGISLPDDRLYGLDRQMNKSSVLKLLLRSHPDQTIHFVEDRLPTLAAISKENELSAIKLYLADWGYNTEQDRQSIIGASIRLVSKLPVSDGSE